MKNAFKSMPALVLCSGMAFAETPKSPQQLAIEKFELAQKDPSSAFYQECQEAIEVLKSVGYTEQDSTTAAYVSGSCGFVGCEDTFLVTTIYQTAGANTRSTVISGLVHVRAFEKAEIFKVYKTPLSELLLED